MKNPTRLGISIVYLRTSVWTGFLIEWLISAAKLKVSKRFMEHSFIQQGHINERDYWWSTLRL